MKIALKTGGTVLTRDSLMITRKEFVKGMIKYLLIRDDKLKKQLEQVQSEFNFSLKPNLIRCVECNFRLAKVKKEDVKNKVPPYVYKTQQNFMYCKKCDKYYWRGTHYYNIKNTFLDIK